MFGNGVRTGMENTAAVPRRILLDHHLALSACSAAAAGAASRVTAGCRIATAIAQATVTTTAASASSAFLSKHIHQEIVLSKEGSGIDGVERRSEGRTEQARRNKCREERDLGAGFGNGDGILKSENLKN